MSKTERIERLEQQVHELQEKLNEQLDAINMLHSDIRDLQQFKYFVEHSQSSTNAALTQYDAK
jgi:predicted RNase H-like nuclease (RuvC/YqgF family)